MNKIKIVVVVGLLALIAADFQVQSLKTAQADHDKAVARATESYKTALLAADRTYLNKLKQLQTNPQIAKVAGEADRLSAAESSVQAEMAKCSDKNFGAELVPAIQAESSGGLHKGMTKRELLAIFPSKPDVDITDADGQETMTWSKGHIYHVSGSGDSPIDNIGGTYDTKVDKRTTVTLMGDKVVDFREEKLN